MAYQLFESLQCVGCFGRIRGSLAALEVLAEHMCRVRPFDPVAIEWIEGSTGARRCVVDLHGEASGIAGEDEGCNGEGGAGEWLSTGESV